MIICFNMKNYLLDTHTLLWFASNSENLSKLSMSIISDTSNHISISYVSIWEIAIKKKIGKLDFDMSLELFCKNITNNNFIWLPIQKKHIFETFELPLYHRDPFDRLLIAQAKTENLILITKDQNFTKYPIELFW